MNYYLSTFKKYATFSGRAQRKEYWYFFLFNLIISIVLGVIGDFISTFAGIAIVVSFFLILFIPSLAVSVRRLHDTGKNGWMILIQVIPFIGLIWFLILMMIDSSPGENEYGSNPKVV